VIEHGKVALQFSADELQSQMPALNELLGV
jgi:hypothetical protein